MNFYVLQRVRVFLQAAGVEVVLYEGKTYLNGEEQTLEKEVPFTDPSMGKFLYYFWACTMEISFLKPH